MSNDLRCQERTWQVGSLNSACCRDGKTCSEDKKNKMTCWMRQWQLMRFPLDKACKLFGFGWRQKYLKGKL